MIPKSRPRSKLDASDREQLARVARITKCMACDTMSERLEVSHCPAHAGGRGIGMKSHPVLLARLCVNCHADIDQHRRDDWELTWWRAYGATQALLHDADRAAAGGFYIEGVD
jgi:hypothetical protein